MVTPHQQGYHSPMFQSESGAIPAVEVPTGGHFLGFADLKAQPAGCPADTNLLTQLAPWIASTSCQLKILNLLKPLIDVIHGLPNPPVKVLQEFSKAAADLAPCLQVPTPAGVLPFLKDLLCLEIRSLRCFMRNLEAITTLAGAVPIAVSAAEIRAVLDSYPPIVGILDLAGGLFQIAGLTIPKAPALAGGTEPDALLADQNAVADFTATLETVVNALGGCQ